jgi:hypothetical protein
VFPSRVQPRQGTEKCPMREITWRNPNKLVGTRVSAVKALHYDQWIAEIEGINRAISHRMTLR